MTLPLSPSAAERFVMTLEGLYRAVAARSSVSRLVGRGTEALAGALILLICQRIRRVQGRMCRMLARFQAGTLRVRRTQPAAERCGDGGAGEMAAAPVVRAQTRLPRRFAWLLPLVPCEAAHFAAQLRLTLATPEMTALLAAAPQAIRVLAPLCRMLGIEAAMLDPRVAGAPEAGGFEEAGGIEVAKPVRPRGRKAAVDWGRIPLPRGVLAAARRDRRLLHGA